MVFQFGHGDNLGVIQTYAGSRVDFAGSALRIDGHVINSTNPPGAILFQLLIISARRALVRSRSRSLELISQANDDYR